MTVRFGIGLETLSFPFQQPRTSIFYHVGVAATLYQWGDGQIWALWVVSSKTINQFVGTQKTPQAEAEDALTLSRFCPQICTRLWPQPGCKFARASAPSGSREVASKLLHLTYFE